MKSKLSVSVLLVVAIILSIFSTNIIYAAQSFDDEVKIVKVCSGSMNSFAIDENGKLWGWGNNDNGLINPDNRNKHLPVVLADGVKDVAAGISNCYFIKNDNSLWAWGWNQDGQIGNGTTTEPKNPVKIMEDVKRIYVTFNQAAAIKNDDSLWMWGENSSDYSILGDGTKINQTTPTKIMDNVKKVSFALCNLILQNDGKLWIVDDKSRKPKQVEYFSNVKDIVKGYYLLDSSSNLVHYNNYLGTMSIVDTEVQSVFEGSGPNIFYISKDGSLLGTGSEYLGDGKGPNTGARQASISIPKGVADVSYSELNSIALLDDGTVWTWGANRYGQAGNGTTKPIYSPVKISFSQKFASMLYAFSGIDYTPKKNIRVFYDGNNVAIDIKALVVNASTLLPMKTTFEKLGFTVSWNKETKVADVVSGNSKTRIQFGNKFVIVNGVKKSLTVPTQEIGGTLMIPAGFLSDIMGYHVVCNNSAKMILLSKNDIIEWRYGGYEGNKPYKEYEYKYVNGVKTSDFRYTGTYHQPVK